MESLGILMIDFYDKENFAMLPDLKWLENPEIFRVNRLDAHSDHVTYASPEETESSLRQSLDGQWRFAFSENPVSRPADFWREDFDLSAFGTITVPGHIQSQVLNLERPRKLPEATYARTRAS